MNSTPNRCARLFLALLFSCLHALAAFAQSGGDPHITQAVVSGGGGTSNSGADLRLDGTAAQSVTATSSGGAYTLSSGFWPGTGTPAPSTLSVPDVTATYGGTVSLTATLSAGGATLGNKLISFSLNGTSLGTVSTETGGVATLNNVSLSGLGAGIYVGGITAEFAGDICFAPSNGAGQLTVQKATPLLQVAGGTFTFDNQPHPAAVSLTGVNNEALSPPAVLYNNSAALPVNAGSYAVTVSYAGDQNYNQVSNNTQSVIINRASQTISFGALPDKTFNDAAFQIGATASSGLPVSFQVVSGPASLSGNTVTISGAGTVTFRASQAGDSNFLAATPVDRAFVVNKATATITLSNLDQSYDGTTRTVSATTNPSGLSVTFTYDGSATAPTNAGSYTVTATVNDSNYQGAASAMLLINKATPVISWSNPFDITYGTPLGNAQLNATASVGGTFIYAPAQGAVLNAGANQNLSVSFTPTDQGNYNTAAKSVSINVLKADQTITFGALGGKTYGDAPFQLSASASSGLAVSFSIVSGPATISGNTVTLTSVGRVTIRASQAGDANYNAAAAIDRPFDVGSAGASIVLGNLSQVYNGTAQAPMVTTTPAGLSFALSYSQNGQPVASPTGAGSYDVTASVTDPNYQGSATGVLVIGKATPTITWNNPANITFGTALGVTQLNAAASVPGTFLYSPPAGTILSTGTRQLSVIFTPADSNNYTTAPASVSLIVDPVTAAALNLDSASYTAGEGDGHVIITVNRTGSGGSAASVDYRTSSTAGLQPCNLFNGIASSRCDYATTVGTLHFAPGETAKTISVPLVDDAYAEGPESFTITLSNAQGENLGAVSSATITIVDSETAAGGNPIANADFFIRQQYIDFLGREPEPAGLAGWLNTLTNCGTSVPQPCDKIEVSAGFFRSPEFAQRGYFVFRFYVAALGRNPTYAEFMRDMGRVSGFLSDEQLEADRAAFVEDVMTKGEFVDRYGPLSNAAFVDTLIQVAGLQSHPQRGPWIDVLNNQTATRAQVLRAFVESREVAERFYTTAFVVMQYFGYLRRDPDAAYQQWIQTLNQTGDYRTMINGFINSNEYVQRFGP